MMGDARGWHWPDFSAEALACGNMSDRERLGLPDQYMPLRFEQELTNQIRELRSAPIHELLATCEDPGAALVRRLAAGDILALCGDPRIDPLHPQMMRIEAATVSTGLDESEIDHVLARYSALGLDRSWIEKEAPRHKTTLEAYAIGRFPVTHEEYRHFLIDTGHCELPGAWEFRRFPQGLSNNPVWTVSAHAADAYCKWLSEKTGRAFRLPTEAEWEYAAAGPEGREFPWGDRYIPDKANTAETGLMRSTPVGIFPEGNSPFGLCDMAGNVEEYVSDDYGPYEGGSFIRDHLVEIGGNYRVARGGSFARFRDLARTRRRHGQNPRSPTYAMGFRLAETLS